MSGSRITRTRVMCVEIFFIDTDKLPTKSYVNLCSVFSKMCLASGDRKVTWSSALGHKDFYWPSLDLGVHQKFMV